METIWAPWRMEYILMEKSEGCIFCQKPRENLDEANYILHRGERNFVILNSYPYNPGHLMVAPYRHVARLEELTDAELGEHFDIVRRSTKAITEELHPHGFNIGINLGRVAGAGVEGHVHTHVVPRWEGDTNFMPVIAHTRVLPEALTSTFARLKGKL
jgi:ATP adenylyltransferase